MFWAPEWLIGLFAGVINGGRRLQCSGILTHSIAGDINVHAGDLQSSQLTSVASGLDPAPSAPSATLSVPLPNVHT